MEEMNKNILTGDEMLRSARWYKMRFVSMIVCVVAALSFGACNRDGTDRNEPVDPTITTPITPTNPIDPTNPDSVTVEPTNPDTTVVTPTDPEPQKHHVELEFWAGTLGGIKGTTNLHFDTINKYVNDRYVDSIYLVLNMGSTFGSMAQSTITSYRNYIQQRTDLSPRIRGRGDFYFRQGVVLPDDSLYFVSKGWTVNAFREKQH